MIIALVIAPLIIITMISSIVSSEASRYLAGSVIIHEVAKMSHVLTVVSVEVFLG
jgi:hypothetical protein